MSGADNVVWLGTPAFPEAARTALADTRLRANLRRATGTIRDKRLAVTSELEDWEELRERAAASNATLCATSTTISCAWRRR